MMLLVMAVLLVALAGTVFDKRTAVKVEMEVEGGEQEAAFHKHSAGGDVEADVGSDLPGVPGIDDVIDVDGYLPKTMLNSSEYVLPGTEFAPPLSAARGRPYYPILNHFQHRDPTSSYSRTWGHFDFRDPDRKWDGRMRPQPSNYDDVPNRDVSNSDFPEGAWQSDPAYMEAFLREAKLLVNRTMEAVYGEYGVGIPPDGSVELTDEQRANRANFEPWTVKEAPGDPGGGSWMTRKSLDGTARRLIHHFMTGDTFKLVLGGHSAAAGHGAGFNQSYVIEAGHVLEPVFAHLGVEFRAYNFAQGGMGTFQQALAGMDLRGKETDMIVWDSRMTERPEYLVNFFLRQALISGNRSPVLMGDGAQLAGFHDVADAAVAAQGNGWVPFTVSEEQVEDVPWAARYLQCARDSTANCAGHQYDAGCWVEREDFEPPKPQDPLVGGQAGWHPGNRAHKRRGRMLALVVLRALEYALDKWEELAAENGGYPIPEEHWHVTEYYRNIREKAPDVPGCFENNWKIGQGRRLKEVDADHGGPGNPGRELEDADFWPSRLCNIPLQGRSLWGPRWDPVRSSLVSIMKVNTMGDIDPTPNNAYMEGPCYDPPDRPAPWTVAPETEPFAPLIGASRRLAVEKRRLGLRGPDAGPANKVHGVASITRRVAAPIADDFQNATRALADDDAIVPGLGVQVNWGLPGVCDGTSHHWCNKHCQNTCFMSGTHDNRGTVCFNGLSGWLVLEVKGVKHGFIGARLEPWQSAEKVSMTNAWTEVNNGGRGNYEEGGLGRRMDAKVGQWGRTREYIERMEEEIREDVLSEGDPAGGRRLGGGQHCGFASDYTFEWAIDGERVSWNKAEFCNHFTRLNYNLDVIKFMDDESRTGDFELAMRITNAGKEAPMCLTHLYWA